MKKEKLEKQASSEIAQSRERFEKAFAENRELDVTPNTTAYAAEFPYADIVTQDHFECWQAAERDTRERCAQLAESQIINWSNNLCDESRAEVTSVKPYSADPIKFGGETKKYAAECLANCAMAVAERIRGKE